LGIAVLFSNNRRRISWRLVFSGILLQQAELLVQAVGLAESADLPEGQGPFSEEILKDGHFASADHRAYDGIGRQTEPPQ
jgi:hypothetical protein